MRVLVLLLAGAFTGAALWAVTGFFVTMSRDTSEERGGQVARALVVPGAVVGGILFVVARLALPPGRDRASARALVLGALGGLGLGAPVAAITDFLMAVASTGLFPSVMLPLMGTSMVLGVGGAWFGGRVTTQPPPQH
jgi:hypothetical protein